MKGLYFDKSDGAGDQLADDATDKKVDESQEGKKPAFSPEQQAHIDSLIGATRKKEREKAQAEAKAEFEAKQKQAKEDADKAAMQEQGKFKELAETAEKEKTAALAKAIQAEAEAKELRMQIAFEDAAAELQYGFVNKQAAKDAFKFIDVELVGDEEKGMKKALEKLHTERPYLFDDADDDDPTTDAKEKGRRPKNEKIDKDKEAELTSRFRIRRPR